MLYNIGLHNMCLLWLTSSNQHKLFRILTFVVYIFIYFYGQIIPLYGYTMIYYISFIHLSVDGYWGCFYLLAYEHCYSEHSCICFVWTYVSVSLGYILKVKLPDHVIFLCLLSWRTARLFHSGIPFTFPLAVCMGSCFCTSYTDISICLFNYSHPKCVCEVVLFLIAWIVNL